MVLFKDIDEIAHFLVTQHHGSFIHRQWFFQQQVFSQLHFLVEIIFLYTLAENIFEMSFERGLAQGNLVCNSIEIGQCFLQMRLEDGFRFHDLFKVYILCSRYALGSMS